MNASPPESPGRLFHWAMIFFLFLSYVATHIDARHHAVNGFAVESFVVAPHLLLDVTSMSIAFTMVIYVIWGAGRGRPRGEWLPRGYDISALGVGLYFLGGGFDFFWHERFGFELNFNVTLSPSHLLLSAAAILTTMGIIRHELARTPLPRHPASLVASLPLLLGSAFLLVRAMWVTFYFDPFSVDFASGGSAVRHLDAVKHLELTGPTAQIAAVVGILIVAVIVVSFVLVPLQRWRLPVGSVTFLLMYHGVFRTITMGTYVRIDRSGRQHRPVARLGGDGRTRAAGSRRPRVIAAWGATARAKAYSGMLPCLRLGGLWRLPASSSSAAIRRGRVCRGAITSSM